MFSCTFVMPIPDYVQYVSDVRKVVVQKQAHIITVFMVRSSLHDSHNFPKTHTTEGKSVSKITNQIYYKVAYLVDEAKVVDVVCQDLDKTCGTVSHSILHELAVHGLDG